MVQLIVIEDAAEGRRTQQPRMDIVARRLDLVEDYSSVIGNATDEETTGTSCRQIVKRVVAGTTRTIFNPLETKKDDVDSDYDCHQMLLFGCCDHASLFSYYL